MKWLQKSLMRKECFKKRWCYIRIVTRGGILGGASAHVWVRGFGVFSKKVTGSDQSASGDCRVARVRPYLASEKADAWVDARGSPSRFYYQNRAQAEGVVALPSRGIRTIFPTLSFLLFLFFCSFFISLSNFKKRMKQCKS